MQELRNIFQLGDFVSSEIDLLFELFNGPVKLFAGIGFKETLKSLVAEFPGISFVLGILNSLDGRVDFIGEGGVSDLLASAAVLFVAEAGVVSRLDTIALAQDSLSNKVEVRNLQGEPWHSCGAQLSDVSDLSLQISCAKKNLVISLVSHKVEVDVHGVFAADSLWWLGLNLSQINSVLIHRVKDTCELAWLVIKSDKEARAIFSFPKLERVVFGRRSRHTSSHLGLTK